MFLCPHRSSCGAAGWAGVGVGVGVDSADGAGLLGFFGLAGWVGSVARRCAEVARLCAAW
jgi:hypothetical protein